MRERSRIHTNIQQISVRMVGSVCWYDAIVLGECQIEKVRKTIGWRNITSLIIRNLPSQSFFDSTRAVLEQ